MLSVEHVTKTYGKFTALEDISLTFTPGVYGLLAPNGAGKTTLIKMLTTLLFPTKGQILWEGEDIRALGAEYRGLLGYLPQQFGYYPSYTPRQFLRYAAALQCIPKREADGRIDHLLETVGLGDAADKKMKKFSGGMLQRVGIAVAMLNDPKLLILDEPTSQLDPIAASDFINTLVKINKDLGLTILLTEHRLEEVFPAADRVFIMDQGKMLLMEPPREAGRSLKQLNGNHRMLLGLPSALRIYHGLDAADAECPLTVRDGRDFLTAHYDNRLRRLERDSADIEAERPVAMRMKDVCFRYERELPDVLEGAALTVYEGEIVSILGGNGAGKTTLLSVISGVNRPYRGKIEIFGKRIQKYSGKELYVRKLASLPQNPQTVFLRMTVREDYEEIRKVMEYGKEEMDQKISEMAELLGISRLLDRHPYDLSGGEQQKAAIGKVLLLQPRLLLLDEPTKGIDAWSKRQIQELLKDLKRRGICILMVTHDVEFAAGVSDRCGLFFDHEIASLDAPEDFFCSNNYYTTAANRISRHRYDNAVTCEDVIELCRRNGRLEGGKP